MRFVKLIYFLVFIVNTFSLFVFAKNLGQSHTHDVVIGEMIFSKKDLVIKSGDSIKWINKDIVPHTVTALDHSFDSKTISPGKSWELTPKNIGRFPYKCDFHPTMTATFSVE